MTKKIVIIDYGVGNILSIKNAISYQGYESIVTHNNKVIENSTHIILPGVGAYPLAMEKLKNLKLIDSLNIAREKGIFILGICLGMQLLFSESDEFGSSEGLNFIEGNIAKLDKFKQNQNIKLPNIGWRNLENNEKNLKIDILNNLTDDNKYYFIHSHALIKYGKNVKVINSSYQSIIFPAVVNLKNIYGCQFHPEKSRTQGLKILENFLNL
jgi:imidazole glycerol-phosphate synthase subunit HisH